MTMAMTQRVEILHKGRKLSREELLENYDVLPSGLSSEKQIENNYNWDELQLNVEAEGQKYALYLKENQDLTMALNHGRGAYSGKVVAEASGQTGWGSIVFKRADGKLSTNGPSIEYEGGFSLNDRTFQIKTSRRGDVHVERVQENSAGGSTCGNTPEMEKEVQSFIHQPPFHYSPQHDDDDEDAHFNEDEQLKGGITSKKNAMCLKERMVLPVAVACDCHFTKQHGGVNQTVSHVVALFAQASAAYEKHFNLTLGLVEIQAMAECDNGIKWNRPCSPFYDMHRRLSDFSEWQTEGFKASNPGVTHLLTPCESKPLIGLSWIGMMCVRQATKTQKGNWIAGASVSSTNSRNLVQVVIHETAHVLGVGHDCDDACKCAAPSSCRDCCPCSRRERLRDKAIYSDLKDVMDSMHRCSCNSMYIMNPTTEMHSSEFSPCTKRELCMNLKLYGGLCLKRPEETKVVSGGVCGNGIKEEGEECDCGTPEECAKDPCCQEGCKLRPNATCSDANDKCCRNCDIIAKEEQYKCRAAIGPCDLDEYCNGESASCPSDRFQPDGLECGSRGKRCASGHCTSRAEQCRTSGRRFQAIGECPKRQGSTSCMMSCEVTGGQCLTLTSHFVDGTPCGYSGQCRDGKCVGGEGGPFGQRVVLGVGLVLLSAGLAMIITLAVYWYKEKRTTKPAPSINVAVDYK